jgi:RNA polymerase sigma factor (sigma-70 family)
VSVPLLRLRSDEQLVALFRAGNDDAFRVIHDRYRARLFAYTRQMLPGSRQDAEDALQDVFVRAYRALRASDRPVSLRAWLYRVAHNRCIDELRRPVPPAPEVLELVRPPAVDPLAETERREHLRRLVTDVRRLPDQQRSALLMRELNGLSYNEMADALGVTIPAVKSLLVRARVGLAQAGEARDTACEQIRLDLAEAHDRGVRAPGMARRHLRDCPGCRAYRTELRGVSRSIAAFVPGLGPLALLAKVLGGLGGGSAAGSGAAMAGGGGAAVAGGGAAAGGATIVSSSVVAVAATKVAVVAAVAVATATGVEAVHHSAHHHRHVTAKPAVVAAPVADPAKVGGASAPALPVPHDPVVPAAPAVKPHANPAKKDKTDDKVAAVSDPTVLDPTTDPATTDPTTTDPNATDPNAAGTIDPTTGQPGTDPTLTGSSSATTTPPAGSTGTTTTPAQTGSSTIAPPPIPESGGASAPPSAPPTGG